MYPDDLRAMFEKRAREGHGEFAIAYALLELADNLAPNKEPGNRTGPASDSTEDTN
jgi:hypothetical protein